MIAPARAEEVFDAALRIQLCEKKTLEVDFSPDQIRVHLPPKRMLALACSVPMSKMTDLLSEMEEKQLIATEQRGGMWVTPLGNRMVADYLAGKYRKEAQVLLGSVVLEILIQHLLDSAPERRS